MKSIYSLPVILILTSCGLVAIWLTACGHDPRHGATQNNSASPFPSLPPNPAENPSEMRQPSEPPEPSLGKYDIAVFSKVDFFQEDEERGIRKLNFDDRHSFYRQGRGLFLTFSLRNLSGKTMVFRLKDIKIKGKLRQYFLKTGYLPPFDTSRIPDAWHYELFDVLLPIDFEVFKGSTEPLKLEGETEIKHQEVINGYLSYDFSHLPVRNLTEQMMPHNKGTPILYKWALTCLQFYADIEFKIEGRFSNYSTWHPIYQQNKEEFIWRITPKGLQPAGSQWLLPDDKHEQSLLDPGLY